MITKKERKKREARRSTEKAGLVLPNTVTTELPSLSGWSCLGVGQHEQLPHPTKCGGELSVALSSPVRLPNPGPRHGEGIYDDGFQTSFVSQPIAEEVGLNGTTLTM